jgi:hypothetical protein
MRWATIGVADAWHRYKRIMPPRLEPLWPTQRTLSRLYKRTTKPITPAMPGRLLPHRPKALLIVIPSSCKGLIGQSSCQYAKALLAAYADAWGSELITVGDTGGGLVGLQWVSCDLHQHTTLRHTATGRTVTLRATFTRPTPTGKTAPSSTTTHKQPMPI